MANYEQDLDNTAPECLALPRFWPRNLRHYLGRIGEYLRPVFDKTPDTPGRAGLNVDRLAAGRQKEDPE